MNFVLPRVNTVLTQVTFSAKRSSETCDPSTNVYKLIPPSNKSRLLLVKLIIAQILRHLQNTTVHYRIHKRPPLAPTLYETTAVMFFIILTLSSNLRIYLRQVPACDKIKVTCMLSACCDVRTCVFDHRLTEQSILRKRTAALLYNETIFGIMSY